MTITVRSTSKRASHVLNFIMASCDDVPYDYFEPVNDTDGLDPDLLRRLQKDFGDGNSTLVLRVDSVDILARYIDEILVPAVLSFGILGNVMNLVVFSRRRLRSSLDEIERSATSGLIALALSDLCFCLVGVPAAFLSESAPHKSSGPAAVYYTSYRKPLFNVFSFLSTWLTVLVSAERYFAVCHPFHARWFIRVRRTIFIHSCAAFMAVIVNIPDFMLIKVVKFPCKGYCLCYHTELSDIFFGREGVAHGYEITWAILGIFIPLVALAYCNCRLVVEVYRSRKRAILETDRYTTSRITLTLLAVVVFFFFLVVPSSLLTFIRRYAENASHKTLRNYRIAIILTNLTQAINFAVNFVLYCAICKQFRDTLGNHMCRKSTSRTSSDTSTKRYQLVNVHI